MNNVLRQIRGTFAVLSALFFTVVTSKIRGYPIDCGPERLVQCAKPLSVLTDSGLTFASSKPELYRMCPSLRGAVKCIHEYSRHCMSLEKRAHFKTLFHGTGQVVNDLCRNETYQEEYLKHAPCMKRVENENEVCLLRYVRTMKEIEENSNSEDVTEPDFVVYQKRKREAADEGIKSVCCAFQEYVECSTQTMRRACGEDAAQFTREFLDKMSSSLIRLHCREYGNRECGLISSASPVKTSALLSLLAVLAYYVR